MLVPPMLENKEFSEIVDENVEVYKTLRPDYVRNESDDVMPLLEALAYREVLLRNYFNAQVSNSFWQTATGDNLTFIGEFFGIMRVSTTVIDPITKEPNVILEKDEDLRKRIALSFETQTTAGSINSYIAHTLKADAMIDDVLVFSPTPGYVTVLIHSSYGVDSAMITRVHNVLNADDVRPLTDFVSVVGADVTHYNVVATVKIHKNGDAATIVSNAKKTLETRLKSVKIGESITLTMLIVALSVDGIEDVTIISPLTPIVVSETGVAVVEAIEVTNA